MNEQAKSINKGNCTKKVYKAKEKNTPGGKVNRSGPRERQLCEEWLNVASLKITLLMKAQHEGALTPPVIVRRNPQVPHSSRSDLSPREQLERQAEFHSSTQDEA